MNNRGKAGGYRLIFGYLGIFLILIGIITLLPLLMLIFYPSEANVYGSFLIPGLSAIAVGTPLSFLIFKREKLQLGKFQDSVLLVSIWLLAILIGSVPFILRGMGTDYYGTTISGNNSDFITSGIFEATSGYSASGLTVFDFSDKAPGYHIYTTYRSLLLLFGGIGLVLIVASTISDRYGLKLYTAEGHNDKLMPNLAKSARLILAIYLGYIVLGTCSYFFLGGMSLFDAFNHSTAAVATGGFSTNVKGIPGIIEAGGSNALGIPINEWAINITSIVLMILGATNFVLHLFLFKGKLKKIFKDCEVRFFGLMVLIFVPLFFVSILYSNETYANNPLLAFKEGSFLFFSSITTTGFNTVYDIKVLGEGALFLSVIMMFIGGGMGSTAGAVKQYRAVVAFKSLYWSIRDRLAPHNMMFPHHVTRLGEDREVSKEDIFEAYGYIVLYLCVLVSGTILLLVLGNSYIPTGRSEIVAGDALFEFASALSGTGLSVGVTGFNTAVNWVLIAGMFAGRLEITCIYFALFRVVRDILRKETV